MEWFLRECQDLDMKKELNAITDEKYEEELQKLRTRLEDNARDTSDAAYKVIMCSW